MFGNSKSKPIIMKKIFSICALFIFSSTLLFAGNPPAAVVNAFKAKFPSATDVKWGKENATEWEAEFSAAGKTSSANFKDDGTFLETETAIPAAEIPSAAMEYIHQNKPGATIKETARIEYADGKVVFEIEVKGDDLLFDEAGKFLRESED